MLRYGKIVGNFKFVADEKANPEAGKYLNTGYTGITKNMTLKDFTQNHVKVPNTTDKNFVFDGWYTDPNFDPAAKIDINTWEVPNHEQDLYANWVAPMCKLHFYTKDPSTGQETQYQDVKDNKYLEQINHDYIPGIQPKTGYKFATWYYFASEADHKAGNKSWFDPQTMTMPCVDWGEETVTDPDTNAEVPVLVLHQE